MTILMLLVVGLLEAGAIGYGLWVYGSKSARVTQTNLTRLQQEFDLKKEAYGQLAKAQDQLLPFDVLHEKVIALKTMRDLLRVEKGRVTITQAELETVEGRLRELEEIERELNASALETKEELKILERKEKELVIKNDHLKSQLANSMGQFDKMLGDLPASEETKTQVEEMKVQLGESEKQIDTLMETIGSTNEQYFALKKRYDALDIEYAQLYEKFAETEAPPSN